jgi:hypothetical protein
VNTSAMVIAPSAPRHDEHIVFERTERARQAFCQTSPTKGQP